MTALRLSSASFHLTDRPYPRDACGACASLSPILFFCTHVQECFSPAKTTRNSHEKRENYSRWKSPKTFGLNVLEGLDLFGKERRIASHSSLFEPLRTCSWLEHTLAPRRRSLRSQQRVALAPVGRELLPQPLWRCFKELSQILATTKRLRHARAEGSKL